MNDPLEREIVLVILQYLQAKHPDWCWIRCEPPSAVRARANKGRGWSMGAKVPEDAWGDGVADILGIGSVYDSTLGAWIEGSVALEVKRPKQKQRPSQIAFQARWEMAGGRYHVVHSVDEVIEIMGD